MMVKSSDNDFSEKKQSIRTKKLLSMLEEIDKKGYDATTYCFCSNNGY